MRTAEIAEAHAALQRHAARDGLTGLLNRTTITGAVEAMLANPVQCVGLALAMVDVDHFKSINDRHGHLGGDEALRQVSRRLADALQPGEFARRYGGEEFPLVLPGPGGEVGPAGSDSGGDRYDPHSRG